MRGCIIHTLMRNMNVSPTPSHPKPSLVPSPYIVKMCVKWCSGNYKNVMMPALPPLGANQAGTTGDIC